MDQWAKVKWSRADQVADEAFLGEAGLDGAVAPAAAFETLRQAGEREMAVRLLALSLPRLEAVAWAARMVRDLTGDDGDRDGVGALRAALLWIQDPSEPRRRAAFDAAEPCDPAAPERMAALAAFYAGGSVAPPDCDPIPAPREAAGCFAAGAVLLACAASADMEAAMETCLDAGVRLAITGLGGEAAA